MKENKMPDFTINIEQEKIRNFTIQLENKIVVMDSVNNGFVEVDLYAELQKRHGQLNYSNIRIDSIVANLVTGAGVADRTPRLTYAKSGKHYFHVINTVGIPTGHTRYITFTKGYSNGDASTFVISPTNPVVGHIFMSIPEMFLPKDIKLLFYIDNAETADSFSAINIFGSMVEPNDSN